MARAAHTKRWDRRGSSNKGQLIMAAGLVAGGALIFAVFLFLKVFDRAPPIDKTTFCPEHVSSITAVLIDATDELSAVQRADIRNRLDRVKQDLPKHARIDLYALGQDSGGIPRVLFSMCNPGTGANADALTENAKLLHRRWVRDFSAKLDEELEKVLTINAASQSPIMEAIQAVAVQSFGAASAREADEKRLVIVSDMIHFTSQYNQYRGVGGGDFEKFLKSDYYRKLRAEMRRVDVEVLYVRRSTEKQVQNKEHVLFWEKFFRESGARLAHLAPI